jgi:GxxExxY protein
MQQPSPYVNQLSRAVIGAAIEVHRALGPGFLESVYEEALCVELELRRIPYTRQHPIAVSYKGIAVGEGRLDLLIGDQLVVELKAVAELLPIHQAQIMSYMKALRLPLGLLINFNVPVLRSGIKRIAM